MEWEWAVGVGYITEMDGKGRVTIPAELRRIIGAKTFKAELMGRDAIVLRVAADRQKTVEQIERMRLTGDAERASVDFACIRDEFGGAKE